MRKIARNQIDIINRAARMLEFMQQDKKFWRMREVVDALNIKMSLAHGAMDRLVDGGYVSVQKNAFKDSFGRSNGYRAATDQPFVNRKSLVTKSQGRPEQDWGNGKLAHMMGYCNHQVTSKPSYRRAM